MSDLPACDHDVLVVTQKIVSKAEGAIVDLTTVEPRPEAVAFAERWDRDPRQLELVLRTAKRVVRMDNGVLITETAHGFVCANGGVDASNVGPASGSIVTLLPDDPDASAARIRAVVREAPGIDVPVVVSRLVRAAVALGDRGRRDRRVRADAPRGPARQAGPRWPGHAVDRPRRRGRARVGRGAGARQALRAAGRGRARCRLHPRRGLHPRRADARRTFDLFR